MLARLSVLARTHSQKLSCHHEQSWLYIPYLIGYTPSLLGRGLGWNRGKGVVVARLTVLLTLFFRELIPLC